MGQVVELVVVRRAVINIYFDSSVSFLFCGLWTKIDCSNISGHLEITPVFQQIHLLITRYYLQLYTILLHVMCTEHDEFRLP